MRARSRSRFLARGTAVATACAIALAGAVVPATMANAAIDATPLIHYTFDSDTGTTIADVSGNGQNATLRQAGATISNGVLSLPGGARGTSAYVEVPTTSLVGKKDLTISTWMSNRSGAANVASAFIGAPVASGASYSTGYWLLNPTNPSGYVKSVVTNAVSGNPWGTEVGPGATNASTTGIRTPAGMSLYTTVIDGTNGQLRVYVNGAPIGTVAIARDVASFGSSLVSYIGRSTYNDPNWNGTVDDFAVYGQALDAAKVQQLYTDEALDRATTGITVPTTATANFTLPTTNYGASISWASNNPAISITGGAASVTRPAAGAADASVTLTATFTVGAQTRTQTYAVTVPADLSDDTKAQRDLEAIAIANLDNVRTNFSVPTTGALGSTITWTVTGGSEFASIRDGVTTSSKTVEVKRPSAGSAAADVVLTATVRNGSAERTAQFRAKVQPMPGGSEKTEAYVWAFFTGEGAGAERVSLAASKGNDALAWNTLNGGQPLFTSDLGTKGLRDPFIIRAPEGDRFYMLATDLKVDGLAGGFTTAQISGSRYIEVWESDDLVHWSAQRHVKVSSDYAGNTWAPEAYWDEELDTFVVFWASNLYPTTNAADRTAVTYNRMMYATTDDFVTFSEPKIWSDVQRGAGRGLIDSTVARVGDVFYRFTKDEASMTIREEKSTNLLATITGTLPGTTGAADQWTLIKERVASGLPNGEPGGTYSSGEGPSIFPANEGDVNNLDWFLFIDQPNYHGGPNYYIPFGSNDLENGDSWVPLGAKLRTGLPQNADGGKPRHGTVIPVTRAEYQKVLEAYAPAIAVTSVGALSATTKAGVAPVLPATAQLTKKDGSQETAAVTWDAVAPSKYATAGTFTVKGVAQDASRQPVEATVTVEPAIEVTVTADTRCVAGKVTVTTRIANDSDATVTVAVTTPYGEKSASLATGKAVSYAFTTRLVSTPAGEVSVTATADGGSTTVTAPYAARSCG